VKVPGGVEARDQAMGVLTTHGWTVALNDHGDAVVDVEAERAHEITRWLASEGFYVNELTPVTRSLEEAFLAITGTTPHTEELR
jgi:hypothetical protein